MRELSACFLRHPAPNAAGWRKMGLPTCSLRKQLPVLPRGVQPRCTDSRSVQVDRHRVEAGLGVGEGARGIARGAPRVDLERPLLAHGRRRLQALVRPAEWARQC